MFCLPVVNYHHKVDTDSFAGPAGYHHHDDKDDEVDDDDGSGGGNIDDHDDDVDDDDDDDEVKQGARTMLPSFLFGKCCTF